VKVTNSPPVSGAPSSTASRQCGTCQLTCRTKKDWGLLRASGSAKTVSTHQAPPRCVSILNLSNKESKSSPAANSIICLAGPNAFPFTVQMKQVCSLLWGSSSLFVGRDFQPFHDHGLHGPWNVQQSRFPQCFLTGCAWHVCVWPR